MQVADGCELFGGGRTKRGKAEISFVGANVVDLEAWLAIEGVRAAIWVGFL